MTLHSFSPSPSEKQLLCMARAILKRSKLLVMDEVCFFFSCVFLNSNVVFLRRRRGDLFLDLPTCFSLSNSVDYATDELIGKTIRQQVDELTLYPFN
jgi:hypothetical protein